MALYLLETDPLARKTVLSAELSAVLLFCRLLVVFAVAIFRAEGGSARHGLRLVVVFRRKV